MLHSIMKVSVTRVSKVRPLKIYKSHLHNWSLEDKLAVDKMIKKYFGHNNLKQYIRGKPVRFGYKFWALCGESEYCYKYYFYCG